MNGILGSIFFHKQSYALITCRHKPSITGFNIADIIQEDEYDVPVTTPYARARYIIMNSSLLYCYLVHIGKLLRRSRSAITSPLEYLQ